MSLVRTCALVAIALACGCDAHCALPDAAASDAGPLTRAEECNDLDAYASGLGCPVFCPWLAPCAPSDVAACLELLRLQGDSCANVAIILGDDACRVCR